MNKTTEEKLNAERRESLRSKYTMNYRYVGEVNWNDMKCDQWDVTITKGAVKVDCVNFHQFMNIQYYMGLGHNRKAPDFDMIFSTLSIEAVDENVSFEDWCDEFGYSDDSIKAKKIYDQVVHQTEHFKNLVGDDYEMIRNAYSGY